MLTLEEYILQYVNNDLNNYTLGKSSLATPVSATNRGQLPKIKIGSLGANSFLPEQICLKGSHSIGKHKSSLPFRGSNSAISIYAPELRANCERKELTPVGANALPLKQIPQEGPYYTGKQTGSPKSCLPFVKMVGKYGGDASTHSN